MRRARKFGRACQCEINWKHGVVKVRDGALAMFVDDHTGGRWVLDNPHEILKPGSLALRDAEYYGITIPLQYIKEVG